MAEGARAVCRFITESEAVTLVCHTSPDGDALGSALALKLAIGQLGKAAEVVCADPVPGIYSFLPGAGEVNAPAEAKGYGSVLAVDCAGRTRLGAAAGLLDKAGITANMDHHGTNTRYADVNWVEERAACGELALEVIRGLGIPVTADMAACLYTALMTDTGCFAYANTTPETMAVAGELIGLGADSAYINRAVYHNEAVEKVRLHAYALEKLELYEGGRIAMTCLSEDEIARYGAKEEHCDGIVESLRDIDTVEIAVFLRQKGGDVKGSMRAKWAADVSRAASRLGGGGHKRAAGFTQRDISMAGAAMQALELAKEELQLCTKE